MSTLTLDPLERPSRPRSKAARFRVRPPLVLVNGLAEQPETWYRRGAHYKIGLQDEIGFINAPPVPVELRSMQLDLEAMRDRGGPSSSMFGATLFVPFQLYWHLRLVLNSHHNFGQTKYSLQLLL